MWPEAPFSRGGPPTAQITRAFAYTHIRGFLREFPQFAAIREYVTIRAE
jgi:hypothetical protein